MKIILILSILTLVGCDNMTGTYSICTRDNGEWTCTNPIEEPVLDIEFHEEANRITCVRRPKLDRMIMSDWKCPGVKGGLPPDMPIGYFAKDKIK